MTDEPKNRINMEKGRQVYEQTRARFASNQALGKTTIRAVAKLLEDMHIEGRVGKFHLESDEPAVRGGTDLGPTPLQYFVAGAAFCLITQMARFAPLYDIPLEEVQADVRAEFNAADKFVTDDSNGAFEQVTYVLTVRSSAPAEQVRLLIEHAERACHAAQSLRQPVSVSLQVHLNGELLPLTGE
ncbi:MAG: hypothetical protein NVS3B14_15060 [Ktedonobacteraceae bacterium]